MPRFLSLLWLWSLFALLPVWAADTPTNPLEPVDRSSPAATYQSFLSVAQRLEDGYAEYLEDKTPERVLALRQDLHQLRELMDLRNLPPAARHKSGNAAAGYLYDILARLPPLDPAQLPKPTGDPAAPWPAKWTIPGTSIQIARLDEGPNAGDYQFTADTVSHLREYYFSIIDYPVLNPRRFPHIHRTQIEATGPMIPEAMVAALPTFLNSYHFNTPLWKILLACGVVLIALVLAACWARFAWRASSEQTPARCNAWRLTIPVAFLLLFSAAEWFIAAQINPSGTFAVSESLAAIVAYYSAAAWIAWLLIYLLLEIVVSSPRIPDNSYDAHLLRLAARILALVAVGAILIQGAHQLGIPALGLLAGLGVGGFALALASQSTIENLFCGLSLFADRPFHIGDSIVFGDQTAKVERIGPRSTRLRARDGSLCTVPNADLAKMHIVNVSVRNQCFLDLDIPLSAESPPAALQDLLLRLRALLQGEPLIEHSVGWPRVRLMGVEVGQIRLHIQAVITTGEYHAFLAVQEQVLLWTLEEMAARDLKLARPLEGATALALPSDTTTQASAADTLATEPTASTTTRG